MSQLSKSPIHVTATLSLLSFWEKRINKLFFALLWTSSYWSVSFASQSPPSPPQRRSPLLLQPLPPSGSLLCNGHLPRRPLFQLTTATFLSLPQHLFSLQLPYPPHPLPPWTARLILPVFHIESLLFLLMLPVVRTKRSWSAFTLASADMIPSLR